MLRAFAALVVGAVFPALREAESPDGIAARHRHQHQASGIRRRQDQKVGADKKRKKKKKKQPQSPDVSPFPSPPSSPPAVPCATASDCPGTDTECQSRFCTNGACVMTFATLGTVLQSQTAYDCHTRVCDGAGGAINQIDDEDNYGTGLCYQSYCTQGILTYLPAPQGIPCIINGQGGNCFDGQCIPR